MYKLTLTKDERAAFDWVGDRYNTGDIVSSLLIGCMPEGKEWDDDGDITFIIPEHVAWSIKECRDEESGWPCFDDNLTTKMEELVFSIV